MTTEHRTFETEIGELAGQLARPTRPSIHKLLDEQKNAAPTKTIESRMRHIAEEFVALSDEVDRLSDDVAILASPARSSRLNAMCKTAFAAASSSAFDACLALEAAISKAEKAAP